MNKIYTILKQNWFSILLSYLLVSIQAFTIIVYPKVLGNTIDHLIAKEYFYILYLFGLFISLVFFNYISNIYDTIVYTRILRKFASKEISNQFDTNVEDSKIIGRLKLIQNVVSFMETNLPSILRIIYGLIGSLYFIAIVDYKLLPYLLVSTLLTLGVMKYFTPKIMYYSKLNNDNVEEEGNIISTRKINKVNNFLKLKSKLMVELSNVDAKFNASIQAVAYGTVSFLIAIYILNNTVTVGSVFSTYRYLFDYCVNIAAIPYIYKNILNIKDILSRLNSEQP